MTALIDASMRLAYKAVMPPLKLWWFVRRPSTEGACVLLWYQQKLLVVGLSYRRGLSLPGGGLKRGESPKLAATRELEEEIGLRLDPSCLSPLPSCLLIEDRRRATTHLFIHHLDRLPELRIDHREIVWAGFLPLIELRQQAMTPVLHHCVMNQAHTRFAGPYHPSEYP